MAKRIARYRVLPIPIWASLIGFCTAAKTKNFCSLTQSKFKKYKIPYLISETGSGILGNFFAVFTKPRLFNHICIKVLHRIKPLNPASTKLQLVVRRFLGISKDNRVYTGYFSCRISFINVCECYRNFFVNYHFASVFVILDKTNSNNGSLKTDSNSLLKWRQLLNDSKIFFYTLMSKWRISAPTIKCIEIYTKTFFANSSNRVNNVNHFRKVQKKFFYNSRKRNCAKPVIDVTSSLITNKLNRYII